MKLRVTAAIAFAVCVAVAIGIYAYSQYRGEEETAAGEIRTFDSYGQIQRALSKIKDEDMPVYMMNLFVYAVKIQTRNKPMPTKSII